MVRFGFYHSLKNCYSVYKQNSFNKTVWNHLNGRSCIEKWGNWGKPNATSKKCNCICIALLILPFTLRDHQNLQRFIKIIFHISFKNTICALFCIFLLYISMVCINIYWICMLDILDYQFICNPKKSKYSK